MMLVAGRNSDRQHEAACDPTGTKGDLREGGSRDDRGCQFLSTVRSPRADTAVTQRNNQRPVIGGGQVVKNARPTCQPIG